MPTKAIRYNRFVGKVGGKDIIIDRPYVVEDLCVGCGFCENVCPVAGDAAIRVEGPAGTALVAADEAASEKPGADPREVFAATLDAWQRAAEPLVYVGPKGLFEYIDGAGEPYLTYAFVRVAAAKYAQGQKEANADLWYFKTPEEAFGAYSRDTSAGARAPEKLGNAGASGEGEVWAWNGANYLHLVSLGNAPASRDGLVGLARALLARLPEGDAKLPLVATALPVAGRDPVSVHYFHANLAAPDVLPADLTGEQGLAIGPAAPAAFARYARDGKPSYWIVVVEYASHAEALAAHKRCLALHASKPEAAKEGDVALFGLGSDTYAAFVPSGKRVGVVFKAQGLDVAKKALADLKQSLGQ